MEKKEKHNFIKLQRELVNENLLCSYEVYGNLLLYHYE